MPPATRPKREDPLGPLDSWLPYETHWEEIRQRFLAAIDPGLREGIEHLMHQPHYSGFGIRAWLNSLATGASMLVEPLPYQVVKVYLDYPEAMPLHDCERCGLAVPILPNRQDGYEGEPERVFFPECPSCGGRTGWYLYWSQDHHDTTAPSTESGEEKN
jgi:hypothetical protein